MPKGRILEEAAPLLARAGIEPEAAFADEDSRLLRFSTNRPGLDLIRVRAFGAIVKPRSVAVSAFVQSSFRAEQ